MNFVHKKALQIFTQRMNARSIITKDTQQALNNLVGEIKIFPVGSDVVRLGQYCNNVSLVVDGIVGRFGQVKNGARQMSGLYIYGDVPDLSSLASKKSGPSLTALTATTIVQFYHDDLRKIMSQHPSLADAFWSESVADNSICAQWVVNVGRRSAISGMAHLFCEMAIKCEHAALGSKSVFPFPISQIQLGDALGLTCIHVNRTLRQLRLMNIMVLKNKIATIMDWDALVRVGEFDSLYMLLN